MSDFKFNFGSSDEGDNCGAKTDFKFNFGSSESEGCSASASAGEGDGQSSVVTEVSLEACEVPWVHRHLHPVSKSKNVKSVKHSFGTYALHTVNSTVVEQHLQQNQTESEVVKAITGHSDLVAGRYEGGLKVWEGSADLCQYLVDSGTPVENSKVLELGCGAGLPGFLAAKMGAASVHFQDFNREVIEMYTMKNMNMNGIKTSLCTFFAGDWASFASLADQKKHRYDLILTAETIYNVSSYPKLLKVFSLLLEESGVILVAAKNDYYGVGGGVLSFTQFLQASQQFQVETVHRIDSGLLRLILKVTRTGKSSTSENTECMDV